MTKRGLLTILVAGAGASAQVTIDVVAYEGPPPPGFGEGVFFNAFTEADSTTDGIGVFHSWLGGDGITGDNASSIWTDEAGLVLVVQGGDEAPGTGGQTFLGASFTAHTGADVALFARTEEGNQDGIWRRDDGEIDLIVLEQEDAPGFKVPHTIHSLNVPLMNAGGTMYFRAGAQPILGGEVIEVIYAEDGDGPTIIIMEGDDGGDGALLAPILPRFVNDAGALLIESSVVPGELGVWLFTDGMLTPILKAGDFVPGIEEFPVDGATASALNAQGHIALVAGIDQPGTTYSVSLTNRSGTIEPLFLRGQPAPMTEPGTNFNSAADAPRMNDLGQVIFATSLNGDNIPGEANYAQWYDEPGQPLQLLVRRDDRLPGAPEGTLIDAGGYLDHNNAGQIILLTTLHGDPVDFTNNQALLGLSADDEPYLILREGDEVEVGLDDVRTLADFSVAGRLTDEGTFLVLAEFADDTEAVLRVNLVGDSCPADFNNDGVLNILDFVAFQNAFTAQDPDADCDGNGQFQILDFLCYQILFVTGCNE